MSNCMTPICFHIYILHVCARISSSLTGFLVSSHVCHACSKHNKLELLLKSRHAVISLKNALHDKGFKVPNLMKKSGCGNPITSNERKAYMGSAQSSPEGQA